ncbi:MAG: DNA polymerase I, partial [Muribaculaceae bacterium]|nr:DNA polymerase I [Muribaculaceae bacterium]
VYMMPPDKDYGQLVTDRVLMYKPSLRGQGFEVRGPAEICAKYGIESPAQVIDLLALEGDTADNIPGCPGVGPKTAAKLIGQFGSVENMLDHAAEIKGALGQKIADNADKIRFSKDLATIRTDVPVEVDFDRLLRGPADKEALRAIFTRLEFKTFLARLGAQPATQKTAAPEPAKALDERSLFDFIDGGDAAGEQADSRDTVASMATAGADYAEIRDEAEIARFVSEAMRAEAVGLSVYATGPEAMTAVLRGIAVATAEGKARFIAIPAEARQRAAVLGLIAPLFGSATTTLCSADIKRDMVVLRREGIALAAPYFDISLAHYLLQPEMRHRLADIAMNVINYQTADFADGTTARKPFAPHPAGEEVSRACEHADVCLRLKAPLRSLLETNGQLRLLDTVELPLAAVLADMEWTGVRIDSAELHNQSLSLSAQLREIEEKAYELAGERFNIASPMQVGEVLFGKLRLDPKAKRTKTGSYSTTEEILEKHRNAHPVVGLILQARSLKKLLATYVNALPELVNP